MGAQYNANAGIYATVGHCTECGVPMLSAWARLSGVSREGHAYHAAHGLCEKHYSYLRRHGSLTAPVERKPRPPRGPDLPFEETLEEYVMIRDDVASIRQAAERMGVKFATLDRLLYRARKQGLSAGLPPLQQRERAMARNRPYRLGDEPLAHR